MEEVTRGRVQRILVVKTAFLALPARVAPQLVNQRIEDIDKILRSRIEEIIREFAKPDRYQRRDGTHVVDGDEKDYDEVTYESAFGSDSEDDTTVE